MIALKCPVCGGAVPASKGGRRRKFCSLKCAKRASYEYSKARGYKKPKDKRLVCAVCGETFYSSSASAKCCGRFCRNLLGVINRGGKLSVRTRARLAASEAKRRAAEACRETAPITVEERGGKVIETRGQRCIGWRSGIFH